MYGQNVLLAGTYRQWATGFTLAMFLTGSGSSTLRGQSAVTASKGANQTIATPGKFYCNTKALTPAERAHHKQLTDRIIATRREIVETEKGYEFQFTPADISLAELANWVAIESKCCPFFDFHLDLEQVGTLLCLRITGEEGIKPFIRTEFPAPAK
jgi:hypothetical protein